MSNVLNVNPDFNPKQALAIKLLLDKENEVTEVLYGGAAGGGKSWLGCVFITIMSLKYEGSRNLIGRETLKRLKLTTLKSLWDVFNQFGIERDKHYKYNVIDGVITFFNGSEILLMQLQKKPSDPDADDYGSLELTSAFIDEVSQVDVKIKNIIGSRIRYKLDEFDIRPKLFMSCNPAKGWIYTEFYKKDKDNEIEKYKAFIQALVTDNPHISKHYIENLKKLDKVSRARLLYGLWEYENELGLFSYDAIIETLKLHETPPLVQLNRRHNPKEPEAFMAVDVARLGRDATVIFVMNADGYLLNYLELNKSRIDETVDEIKKIATRYNIQRSNIAIDSDGVGGGVVDYLDGCVSIVNGSKAKNGENYQNLKTQLYAKLAEEINLGNIKSCIEFDVEVEERIKQELMIIERVRLDQDGKFKITSKDDIKQKLGRSPDYADALAYLMYFRISNSFFEESPVVFFEF